MAHEKPDRCDLLYWRKSPNSAWTVIFEPAGLHSYMGWLFDIHPYVEANSILHQFAWV